MHYLSGEDNNFWVYLSLLFFSEGISVELWRQLFFAGAISTSICMPKRKERIAPTMRQRRRERRQSMGMSWQRARFVCARHRHAPVRRGQPAHALCASGGSRFVAASWTCFSFLFAIASKKKKLEPSPPKQRLFTLMQVSGGTLHNIPVLVFPLRPFLLNS